MVVKMMRWRPWPPQSSKKFEVKLVLRRIENFDLVLASRLVVEIRWKGPKYALSSLRRTLRRNFTKEEELRSDGVVEWNEEFQNLCTLTAYKENVFHPWEIGFTVLNVLNQGPKNKVPIVGTASLNLAEFAPAAEEKELEINVPLTLVGGSAGPHPSLCFSPLLFILMSNYPTCSVTMASYKFYASLSSIAFTGKLFFFSLLIFVFFLNLLSFMTLSFQFSLSLVELRTSQESSMTGQRLIVPAPLSPMSGEPLSTEKDELSALKAGLRKVKILTEYVSTRRSKMPCHEGEDSEGRYSARSEDAEYTYPFDTESLDDLDDGELENEKDDSSLRKSFSYGTLADVNCAGRSYFTEMRINGESEDWIYYSNRKSDVGCLHVEYRTTSVSEQSFPQSSKRRSILSWRKRKLSFRSPKAKGEPLLKKAYGEEGGDDIDFDRRQLNSSDESLSLGWHKVSEGSITNRSSVSEFGDDNFAVGMWENKEVVSRDGHMKLQTQVFFASIDQRSERAAGESACTALVAVIADWFQNNQHDMPIKSQFDSLIREGSLEWRNLCENETYRERFPDKHFDLETVLQAKIRPLTVTPEKSFIGFFHPEGIDEGCFDFLHGAMSFDSIWDEISCTASDNPRIYIVSWNDHFFVLKVEPEAYYIIDTLGERLYEGCNQAYILKFDSDTNIYKLPSEAQSSEEKSETRNQNNPKESPVTDSTATKPKELGTTSGGEGEVVCKEKESCKEYIKSFLAAIPIRELQFDIKKGLRDSTPLHHRLQVEFHYTEFLKPTPIPQATTIEVTAEVEGAC